MYVSVAEAAKNEGRRGEEASSNGGASVRWENYNLLNLSLVKLITHLSSHDLIYIIE